MSGSPLAPSAGDDKVVVALPIPPEEKQRRLMVEIHRLAGLATVDWTFQLTSRADYFTEHFGVSPAEMKTLILARLKDIEKDKVEERRIEERAEKKQKADEKKQKSADKEKKSAEAKKSKAEQKEVERKAKEKQKSFAGIIKLPVDQRDAELTKLAKRLEEDLTALREEFIEFVGDIATPTTSDWSVEPWGEPVATAGLSQAQALVRRQRRYPQGCAAVAGLHQPRERQLDSPACDRGARGWRVAGAGLRGCAGVDPHDA
jgi:translation initiation factor 4G